MKEWILEVLAILAIAAVICYCASQGINGSVAAIGTAAIGGIAGWAIPRRIRRE